MNEKALINEKILIWARKEVDLDVDQASRKIGVKPQKLVAWENGEDKPTIKQLKSIANVYKRAFSLFYLKQTPESIKDIPQYRTLPDPLFEGNYYLNVEMRNTLYRRDIALELMKALGYVTDLKVSTKIDLNKNVEAQATELRKLLGVDTNKQYRLKDHDNFNYWTSLVEDLNILVFQFGDVELEQARAFSIRKDNLPIIAINRKDTIRGKTFSLMHELSHLLLGDEGVCDFNYYNLTDHRKLMMEKFCNHMAGSV
jgi:transcriptional regulator with XRE-family HTH domain